MTLASILLVLLGPLLGAQTDPPATQDPPQQQQPPEQPQDPEQPKEQEQDPDELPSFSIEPGLVLSGVPFEVTIKATTASGDHDHWFTGTVRLSIERANSGLIQREVAFEGAETAGQKTLDEKFVAASGDFPKIIVTAEGREPAAVELLQLPGWTSVVPPLLAILIAILFRQVVVALVLGILAGAMFVSGFDPIRTLLSFSDTYVIGAAYDRDHLQIIIFSIMLGGMAGVMSRSGGMHGIVDHLMQFARSRRSGQVATASLGTTIFFDDYANCLIVGNTARPLTDRLGISREKLAYIVDSTAAPVASLVPLSTWVGYQVSQVGDSLKTIGDEDLPAAYPMILAAIPYMFYPIFALVLVFLVGAFGRDMFTMLKAERRAAEEGKLLRDGAIPLSGGDEEEAMQPLPGKPRRAMNALIPVLAVIAVTIIGIGVTGKNAALEAGLLGDSFWANLRAIVGEADSYKALMWASITGVALAILLAVAQRILSLADAMDACVAGMKAMFLAFVILVLAWSLGSVTSDLHADAYLASLVENTINPHWLPIIVFVLAAATAFATGTAWGTMAILIPLVVPLAYSLATTSGLDGDPRQVILLGSIASILGGAVFGDHCSPISDTTVLSSMATSCDHVDHVRTQLPYAVIAALFAVGAGYVPAALGYSIWLTLPLGLVVLALVVRFAARPVTLAGVGEEIDDADFDQPDFDLEE